MYLDNNILENFLKENKNITYSIKTLSKRLNVKKKHIYFLYKQSNNIKKGNPLEVGSNKHSFNIFKYNE